MAAALGGGCALTCSVFEQEQPSPGREVAPQRVGAGRSLPLLVTYSFSALGEESRNDSNNLIKQQLWTSVLEEGGGEESLD